jgi:hypothetical protein
LSQFSFSGHEQIALLDVQHLVAFEIALQEEHRRVELLRADLKAHDPASLRVFRITVQKLKALLVIEQRGSFVGR